MQRIGCVGCGSTLGDLPEPPTGKTGWPWRAQDSEPLGDAMEGGAAWPRISIVIPSLNQAGFLEAGIRSVLLQGYPNAELIVIDAGSTDGSVEILRKYAARLSFWVSEPDRGQSHGINKGLRHATGEIVHWMNSDDLLLPSALSSVAQAFGHRPPYRIVTGQAKTVGADGQCLGEIRSVFSSWEDFATRRCNVAQVATFFERGLFEELGMIDEALEYSMDSELLLRFCRHHPPRVSDAFLTAYRVHGKTKFSHNRMVGFKEADKVYLKYVSGTALERSYKHWSALHWLALSSFEDLNFKERFQSIGQALKMRPALLGSFRLCIAVLRASRLAWKERAGGHLPRSC